LDRALGRGVSGHDDNNDGGVVGLELAEEGDAVHRLHVDVGQDKVELFAFVFGEGLFAVGRKSSLIAGRRDYRLQHFMNGEQIIDDKDGRHGRGVINRG
jgi:hypothetical protein